MDEWADFKSWMQAEYRPLTCYTYWLCCKQFLNWSGIATPKDLEYITPSDFIRFDGFLKAKGLQDRHVHGFALRSLLSYYGLRDLVGKVPARREVVQTPPRWLPKPVIKIMLEMAPDHRMKSIASIGYDLALRVSEALMLDLKPKPNAAYIDLKTGMANIYRKKTKQFPWLLTNISQESLTTVREYVSKHRAPTDPQALFTTAPFHRGLKGGGRMSIWWVEILWRRWMRELGLDPHLWKHKLLRHSRLTWMHVEGKDLIEIAKYAGHSSPAPTLIYTHLASQYLTHPDIFLTELKGSRLYTKAQAALRSGG